MESGYGGVGRSSRNVERSFIPCPCARRLNIMAAAAHSKAKRDETRLDETTRDETTRDETRRHATRRGEARRAEGQFNIPPIIISLALVRPPYVTLTRGRRRWLRIVPSASHAIALRRPAMRCFVLHRTAKRGAWSTCPPRRGYEARRGEARDDETRGDKTRGGEARPDETRGDQTRRDATRSSETRREERRGDERRWGQG